MYLYNVVAMVLPLADEDGTGSGSGYTPNIVLSWDYFPWMKPLSEMVGGTQAVALTVLAFALLACAVVWAVGHFTDLGHLASRAKVGMAACCVAAAIVAAAAPIIGFFARVFGAVA